MRFRFAILAILAASAPAAAQQPTSDWVFGANGEDIVLEVGGGILTRPEYEGAKDYTLRPWPIVELGFLRLPYFGTFGGGAESGIKFSPSLRIISERDDDDHSELAGLGDVDLAVEAGGKVSYRSTCSAGSSRSAGASAGIMVWSAKPAWMRSSIRRRGLS